jgi:hypothetical protein
MTFKHKLAHRLALLRGPRVAGTVAVHLSHSAVTQLVVSLDIDAQHQTQRVLHAVKLWRPVS